MCTTGTVAQIFINCRKLHIKRLIGKFKQRTNVPYLYHYKKGVPYQRTVLLCKNWGVPYGTCRTAKALFYDNPGRMSWVQPVPWSRCCVLGSDVDDDYVFGGFEPELPTDQLVQVQTPNSNINPNMNDHLKPKPCPKKSKSYAIGLRKYG